MNDKKSISLNEISNYRTVLFALAIMMVVFHHLTFKFEQGIIGKAYSFLRVTGASGVDVFLFLSGLGCYYSFSANEDIWQFYKRRLLRIIPAFLIVAIPAYFITDIIVSGKTVLDYLLDVTLLSFWKNGGSDWYIAASLFLYLMFPIIYRLMKKGKLGLVCMLAVWLIICLAVYLIDNTWFQQTSRLWARIPVFLFGTMIGPAVKEGRVIDRCKAFVLACIVFTMALGAEAVLALKGSEYAYSFVARLIYCPLAISLVFILICLFSIFRLPPKQTVLCFVGGITLEIYMLNQRMINLCTFLGTKILGASLPLMLLWNVIGVMITIVLSVMLSKLIQVMRKMLQ